MDNECALAAFWCQVILWINGDRASVPNDLTHWGQDKMAAFSQTTFSNVFSSVKCLNFDYNFVPKSPINNILALVQIMAWRGPRDKPFSEPMMISLLTHIFITQNINQSLNLETIRLPRNLLIGTLCICM